MEEKADNLDWFHTSLVNGLKTLCLDSSEYKNYLPDFVDISFEATDGFYNAFVLLPQLIDAERISLPAIAALLRIHMLLDRMHNKDAQYELDEAGFFALPEWTDVRKLSAEALEILGEPIGKPDYI